MAPLAPGSGEGPGVRGKYPLETPSRHQRTPIFKQESHKLTGHFYSQLSLLSSLWQGRHGTPRPWKGRGAGGEG